MKTVYLKVKAKEKGKERVRAVQSRVKHQVIVPKIQNQFYSKNEHLKVLRNCTEIFLMTTKMDDDDSKESLHRTRSMVVDS